MTIDFNKLDSQIASDEVMALADKIGIHYTTLYKILRNGMDPSYLTGLALAEHCETTLDKLAGRRGGASFQLRKPEHPFETLRSQNELTTRELAHGLKTNVGFLYLVRKGDKVPGCAFVERVAVFFDVRIHDLAVAMRAFSRKN